MWRRAHYYILYWILSGPAALCSRPGPAGKGISLFSIKRLVLAGVTIAVAAVIVAAAAGVFRTSGKLYTVSQLKAQGSSVYDKSVKLRGNVVPGSTSWDPTQWLLKFTLSEGSDSFKVNYSGTWNPNHGANVGGEVIVEGRLLPAGTFVGNSFDRNSSPFCQQAGCHG